MAGRLSIYVKDNDKMKEEVLMEPADEPISHIGEEIHFESSMAHEEEDADIGLTEEDVTCDMDNVLSHEHEEEDDPDLTPDPLTEENVRRIPLGPPQDTNVKPKKKIPPQVHFARVEDALNKMTKSVTMDKVFSTTLATRSHGASVVVEASEGHEGGLNTLGSKKKRQPLDEFDKKLGLRIRNSNPIAEISETFLGPLMRIFRIIVIAVRIAFNIGIWTDPFISFWVLCGLIVLMLVLAVFPWRMFFLVVGLVGLGPQVSDSDDP